MKPTLHQLRIFRTVAEHNSFTRAAEVLHLSQPAVSIQVKKLEGSVGLPLIEQIGKKIHLTEAGEAVYHCAQTVSDQIDDTTEHIDGLKGMKRGRLRISVATTASNFVTRMLAAFSDLYPDVAISLDVTNRESLLRQLEANEPDLVIMGKPPASADLRATAFMDNPLVVFAPPDHPITKRTKLTMPSLSAYTFVVREPGSGTRAAIERFFQAKDVEINFVMEMTSNEAIKQAVQAGLGLGIASRHTLELELDTDRLVIVSVEGFPILRQWYLVQRSGRRLSPIAQLFEGFVLRKQNTLVK